MNFQDELKTAMLGRDPIGTRTLRMLITAIKNETITLGLGPQGILDETTTVIVIKRLIKQREDSKAMFLQGGGTVQAEKEQEEIDFLRKYLPSMLEGEALKGEIQEIIAVLGFTEKKQTGLVMKALKGRFGAAFDGKEASSIAGSILQ